MTENREAAVAAIDVGAGSGSKLGLFGADMRLLVEGFVPVSGYGTTAPDLATALADGIRGLLRQPAASSYELGATGVACPGLLTSEGILRPVVNLPCLTDANLRLLLAERLKTAVVCLNDADAGAVAEWNLQRTELLYWVLGGGWGGAWVSADGTVRFPSIDWNGDDASLHPTNEPGYAIPLSKRFLANLFAEYGASFDRFAETCLRELSPSDGVLRGPNGRDDCVRAELVVSGSGRHRVFHSIASDSGNFEKFLTAKEREDLGTRSSSGYVISKLGKLNVPEAVTTDRIFGTALGAAGAMLLSRARADGCPPGIPVYLGGKPSRALPLFAPATLDTLGRHQQATPLLRSGVEQRGMNPNLQGAAVSAHKVLEKSSST